jgi:hypothetical protein
MIPRSAAREEPKLEPPQHDVPATMTTALHDLDALEPIDIDGLKAQGVPPVAQYLVDQDKFVLLGGKRGIYRLAGTETICYFTSLDQLRLHLLGQSLTRLTVELA